MNVESATMDTESVATWETEHATYCTIIDATHCAVWKSTVDTVSLEISDRILLTTRYALEHALEKIL
jgi:hypothetical protein